MGARNRALDGRAHECHLANTTERLCAAAVSGSATSRDAAQSQIPLDSLVIIIIIIVQKIEHEKNTMNTT